ncbi:MAG: hypothetical protein IKB15_07065 [Alistipes sp.]|nr:hypothetical protein [Alistipes sp.]
MKVNQLKEYESPEVEIILTAVEQGFTASYGNEGEAGDGFDGKEWGEF